MKPLRHLLGHLLSCKDATRVLSQAQDRTLSGFARWKLRMHLGVCDACSRFEQQLHFLREAMQRFRS